MQVPLKVSKTLLMQMTVNVHVTQRKLTALFTAWLNGSFVTNSPAGLELVSEVEQLYEVLLYSDFTYKQSVRLQHC